MEEPKKTQVLGATFYGSVTINGPMFHIHDNEHVHIHSEQPMSVEKTKQAFGYRPSKLEDGFKEWR